MYAFDFELFNYDFNISCLVDNIVSCSAKSYYKPKLSICITTF